jgi:glycosyltransferase involved in cell wall biosynthesis
VARFVPENTVDEFFNATSVLSQKYPVVLVGSAGYGGQFDDRARALANAHDSVQWYGHVSDDKRLFSLWQHAGVYFHGHSVGGTNPALVQAMALGAPTVARDTVYNREVLGDAGEYVQADSRKIVSAVERVMDAPLRRRAMSSEALKRAQTTYSWSVVCGAYHDRLEALSSYSGESNNANSLNQ